MFWKRKDILDDAGKPIRLVDERSPSVRDDPHLADLLFRSAETYTRWNADLSASDVVVILL